MSGGDIGARPPRCACAQNEVIPAALILHAPQPSPFRVATVLQLDVPRDAGRVTLAIYDVAGRLVRKLVDGGLRPGRREFVWRGDDDSGHSVGSGIYFVWCESDAGTGAQKLVLTR